MRKVAFTLVSITALAIAGCGSKGGESAAGPGGSGETIRVAYVTNGIDPFWTIAEAGAKAGAKEFGVEVEVLMPPKGLVDQTRMIETLLSNGSDGIALSPIDAANQVQMINEAAKITNVITQDSDAPDSNRLCFVGMDNYKAGRQAGVLVKEALPQGGEVMLFVGRLEQLNSQQRRQGVIDELLGRPEQASGPTMKFDPNDAPIEGNGFKILGTRTDNFDYSKAKSNAEDAIAGFADLDAMVGLFAYNIPMCLSALQDAGKLGQIKLISFDEQDGTLKGIQDGHVQGTVSQQPYYYGYDSVRILAALARGDKSVIPANGFYEVPSVVVRKENVDTFWAELKKLRGDK
jgi:ribose transport system substrate-binding protein